MFMSLDDIITVRYLYGGDKYDTEFDSFVAA